MAVLTFLNKLLFQGRIAVAPRGLKDGFPKTFWWVSLSVHTGAAPPRLPARADATGGRGTQWCDNEDLAVLLTFGQFVFLI